MVKCTEHTKPQFNDLHIVLAKQLYCEGYVTLGRAAKIAGMSYKQFAEHLSELGIAVVDYPTRLRIWKMSLTCSLNHS